MSYRVIVGIPDNFANPLELLPSCSDGRGLTYATYLLTLSCIPDLVKLFLAGGLLLLTFVRRNKTDIKMKLPVYLYGHPVLREVCHDITADYEGLDTLINDMWETMYATDGIGLAAPQIGRDIRLFVIDADPMSEDFPECKGFKRCFINAHIVEYSDETLVETEGCLSIPTIHEKVERPRTITIEYVNEEFEPQRETISGFAARVVQHEYDHIEGVLFIDKISAIRKTMVKAKLLNIAKGKVNAGYRTVTAPQRKK